MLITFKLFAITSVNIEKGFFTSSAGGYQRWLQLNYPWSLFLILGHYFKRIFMKVFIVACAASLAFMALMDWQFMMQVSKN